MKTLDYAEASAPGRVNLIGEHTDYNGGFVLPTALPQETRAAVRRRVDGQVTAVSADLGDASAGRYPIGGERQRRDWLDYVQGLTWALGERGCRISGFDLSVASDVPLGKGLSSSASLEVAVLRALRALEALPIDDLELAMIAHRAETAFVGAPVGIMDQMVCSLGDARSALFLDAATREYEKIPMPRGAAIGVIDSGIAHEHATGDYRIRRRECDEAAARLGVPRLRDLGLDDLPRIEALPDPLGRRARHVVTEDARVLAAVDALRRDDPRELGRLFLASHASMRDDFAVSLPEIDRLVEIAAAEPAVFGARLTGGGFGGAIVFLCTPDAVHDTAHRVAESYSRTTGRDGRVLIPQERHAAA